MTLDNSWSAYIFRDGKVALDGRKLVKDLAARLRELCHAAGHSRGNLMMDVLLRAGELECALRDAGSPDAGIAESVTDRVADALVNGTVLSWQQAARAVEQIIAPGEVKVAPPEGFAYYSLHPLDMADLTRGSAPRSSFAAVVGIRSIGTTLSATVQATLRGVGVRAERTTVRPAGHPYNRETHFPEEQLAWIAKMRSHNAPFLVVDEGPGMSGSSFLSVGDALLAAGVARSDISFLCTRQADPSTLTANNAAERWPAFKAYYTSPTRYLPSDAKQYIAGGIWRAKAFASEEEWPGSWIQMERLKFLSHDGSRLFRYEGLGRFGEEVRLRAVKVAEFGFGPMPQEPEQGFGVYPMLAGRYLSAQDAKPDVLDRIAEYCAFLTRELPSTVDRTPELETMLRFNTQEEFGIELPLHLRGLAIERPVIADGRMLPHKWMQSPSGESPNGNGWRKTRLIKIDSASHGDDHFFPGPTDIAWDLAGTIVEWRLGAEAASYLLERYRVRSGDDAARRVPAYLLAYGVFRTAYCKMAAAAMKDHPEQPRMYREYQRYREQSLGFLAQFGCMAPSLERNKAQVA